MQTSWFGRRSEINVADLGYCPTSRCGPEYSRSVSSEGRSPAGCAGGSLCSSAPVTRGSDAVSIASKDENSDASGNAGRGRPVYDFSPFVEKDFHFGERVRVRGRVESFNVFNHANFVGFSGTYGNGVAPGPGFGQPLTGITNQLLARSLQFSLRLMY